MSVRYFALTLGTIYLLLGVLGFFPGLVTPPMEVAEPLTVDEGYGNLFGIFPVNILHNLVHIATGLWGIASYRDFSSARFYARAVAVIFGVLTIMGLIPGLNTAFGLVPLFGNDIWLHGLITAASIYFGWIAPEAREEPGDIERQAAA